MLSNISSIGIFVEIISLIAINDLWGVVLVHTHFFFPCEVVCGVFLLNTYYFSGWLVSDQVV